MSVSVWGFAKNPLGFVQMNGGRHEMVGKLLTTLPGHCVYSADSGAAGSLMNKLEIHNVAELARYATRHGIIRP